MNPELEQLPQDQTATQVVANPMALEEPARQQPVSEQPPPEQSVSVSSEVLDCHGGSAAPGPELRQRLLRQFEVWVDRILAGESAPDGIPSEILAAAQSSSDAESPDVDLYSLFSAMTTLTGEIRLQGRTFKQLTDALAPVSAVAGKIDVLQTVQLKSAQALNGLADTIDHLATQAASASDTGLPSSKDVLAVLFDLYDRLERSGEALQASIQAMEASSATGWRRWLAGGDSSRRLAAIVDAIRQGRDLTLSRLEAALAQWEIRRIGDVGDLFDPATMMAVEVAPAGIEDDGRVIEVYRSGYARHELVLVTAQVKVGRAVGGRQ